MSCSIKLFHSNTKSTLVNTLNHCNGNSLFHSELQKIDVYRPQQPAWMIQEGIVKVSIFMIRLTVILNLT